MYHHRFKYILDSPDCQSTHLNKYKHIHAGMGLHIGFHLVGTSPHIFWFSYQQRILEDMFLHINL